MKKIFKVCIYFSIILITIFGLNVYQALNNKVEVIKTNDDIPEELKVESNEKVYNKLNLKNVYISNKKGDKASRIFWYYNSKDKMYYLFLPKSINRNKMEIGWESEPNIYVSIYDNNDKLVDKVQSSSIVSLQDEIYTLKLETNVKNTTSYKIKIMQSNLPSLHLALNGGASSYKKVIGDRTKKYKATGYGNIIDTEGEVTISNLTRFKGRGKTSWYKPKKPFSIKFEDKVEMFGMKEAKEWVLIANYRDGTLSRNYLWYKFSRDLGLEFSPEAEPIELYVNNTYMGSYLLVSKIEIKKNRVDIGEDDYLFELDGYLRHPDIKLKHGNKLYVSNKKLKTANATERKQIIADARKLLNHVEDLIYNPNTPVEELEKYIDFESFAKYYWVSEISQNYDALKRSFYLYTKDGKLYAGPMWDMENTLNVFFQFCSPRSNYILHSRHVNRVNENWYRYLFHWNKFSDTVDEVYFKYHDVIYGLPDTLDEYSEYIKSSAAMNYVRWPYYEMRTRRQERKWPKGNKSFASANVLLKRDINGKLNWLSEQYHDLYYEHLEYTMYIDNKEYKTKTWKENMTIFVPNKVNKIEIYGINGDKRVKIKEIEMVDNFYKESIILRNNTSTTYKRNNRKIYEVSFLKKED